MEGAHEQQIQHDVHDRREDQKVQRAARIAHRAQDARADVIEHQPRHACKIDAQVFGGLADHVGGRIHHLQHQRGGKQPQRRADNGGQQRQQQRGMHGVVHAAGIPGAKGLGDDYARAHGQPRKEADQRVDDIARGTDGGQRLLAHKLADHHAVHRVVQLLENLADQHGNGEADQMAGDGALRHIDALFLGRHSKSFHKKAEIAIIIPHIALLAKGAAKKFQIRKMKKAPRRLANSSLCVIMHNMRCLKGANEDEVTLSNGS